MKGDNSMPGTTRSWRATASVWGIFVFVFGFLTVGSFTQQSATVDEPIHLLAGYSYLKFSDYRINPEHPPLAKAWAALPLLWLNIDDHRPDTRWSQNPQREPADRFYPLAHSMFFVRNDAETLFFYGKIQMIVIAILLGLFVYLWTRELFGFLAAVISLFIFALDPNILAHSAVIHTDLPFAAIFLIGTYFFWRVLQNFTWRNLAVTSACFGLAVITKFSYVWVLPAWITLALVRVLSAESLRITIGGHRLITNRWAKAALLAACFLGCAVVAYVMLWTAYGFRYAAATGYPQTFLFTDVVSESSYFAKLLPLITKYHLLPEAWVYGQFYVMRELARSMYFFGEVSDRGFWTYFPVAFLVKTPVPTILVLCAASWVCLTKPAERARSLILLVPALVCFCAAVVFRLNIGIRHLLPMYPFLFILIGGFIAQIWQGSSRLKRGGLVVLGVWYIWSSFSAYPHYLAYFNEVAGGPKNGHKVLLDSNLDWGQDLQGLKPWLDRHGIKQIQLVYFGAAEPRYYGIDDFYSTENLARGTFAAGGEVALPEYLVVSANFLYGGELFLPAELAARLKPYAAREPVGSIGYSLLIFRLNLADAKVYEDAASITARKGAIRLAESLLQKALQLNPAGADAHYQLGALMGQQGRLSEAIESYETAIKLEPGNEKAHFSLANALIREQQFDAALRHYREAVKIRPNFAEAFYSLGRVSLAQGQMVEAIEYFREALRAKPEFAEAHESLAQALARQGKADEAGRHYQEALRILKQRRDPRASRP